MTQQHWDNIFATKANTELGWYEKDNVQTLKLLTPVLQKGAQEIFIAGAGSTGLVEELLDGGHKLIVNDISDIALSQLREKLAEKMSRASWLQWDITTPLPGVKADVWVDRAVLHFFLKEEDITQYFDNLRSVVVIGGYVLLAQFSPDAVSKCAGLDLHRYSLEEMQNRLGTEFETVQHEQYIYTTPFGAERQYIYGLFKRMAD